MGARGFGRVVVFAAFGGLYSFGSAHASPCKTPEAWRVILKQSGERLISYGLDATGKRVTEFYANLLTGKWSALKNDGKTACMVDHGSSLVITKEVKGAPL